MQAAERAHNFLVTSVFKRLQPSSRCCHVDHRFDLRRPDSYTGRWRRWDVEKSPLTVVDTGLWASTTLAVESPTHLFVASHWLERSSCRFPVTLLVVSRADHSTSQVHLLCGFYLHFLLKACFRSLQAHIRPPADWSTAVMSHSAVNSDALHVVFRSLLKIFKYAAKQACKQLQCNKAKLSQPASINGLHVHRALWYASRTNAH